MIVLRVEEEVLMTTRVWRRFTAVLTLCSLFANLLPRADVAVARTIDPIESSPSAARPVAQSAGTVLFLTGSAASAAGDNLYRCAQKSRSRNARRCGWQSLDLYLGHRRFGKNWRDLREHARADGRQ